MLKCLKDEKEVNKKSKENDDYLFIPINVNSKTIDTTDSTSVEFFLFTV